MTTHTQHNTAPLYIAFVVLMLLLAATMGISFIPLGHTGTWIGLSIAVAKTLLVALVFMALWKSPAAMRLAAAAAILWLSLCVLLVMADYVSRGWQGASEESLPQAIQYRDFDRVEYR